MSISRRALIIINPGEPGDENYAEGVYKDAENYHSFFTDPLGGYWYDSEIKILETPSKNDVYHELVKLNDCDFSIVIFCGHGYHSSRSHTDILEIKKGVEIDSADFRDGDKRICILDNCREIIDDHPLLDHVFAESKAYTPQLNPERCRAEYNKSIDNCRSQLIVAKSCSENEYSGDNSEQGGYYSSSLLKGCGKWLSDNMNDFYKSGNTESLSIAKAHELIKEQVAKISEGQQNPAIEKPKIFRGSYLPFAVIA